MIQTEVSVIPLPDEEDRSELETPETEEQPVKRTSVEVCRFEPNVLTLYKVKLLLVDIFSPLLAFSGLFKYPSLAHLFCERNNLQFCSPTDTGIVSKSRSGRFPKNRVLCTSHRAAAGGGGGRKRREWRNRWRRANIRCKKYNDLRGGLHIAGQRRVGKFRERRLSEWRRLHWGERVGGGRDRAENQGPEQKWTPSTQMQAHVHFWRMHWEPAQRTAGPLLQRRRQRLWKEQMSIGPRWHQPPRESRVSLCVGTLGGGGSAAPEREQAKRGRKRDQISVKQEIRLPTDCQTCVCVMCSNKYFHSIPWTTESRKV